MTWGITISGHNGTEEYGTPEYKAREQAIADKAREFAAQLVADGDGVGTAVFNGNFVMENVLLPKPDPNEPEIPARPEDQT